MAIAQLLPAFLTLCAPTGTAQRTDHLATTSNRFYVGNRAPLAPAPFRKLPVGAIRPEGWVRKQLELEADGFTGRLAEISPWLNKQNNAWLSPTGAGKNGWEEVPYWLKGFGDLGYILGDARITREAKVWIDGILGSQRPDGWFGPESNRVSNDGKPDMWPNMVALSCLQTYYEHTGDRHVLDFMTRYFRWQLAQPKEDFYLSYWEKQRGGDNMDSVYWLYNRTGDSWLLDLARKIHERTAPWVDGVPDEHGVNFGQAFREPAEYWALSHDPRHLAATERDYQIFRGKYGQVPGGMYGADENARTGFGDPRQAAETCAMVEMMLSDETLLTQTGDPRWAERCEDVAFNSLPASMTSDLKALHYLTSPNMIQCDAKSKAPGLQNGGPMLLFDPHDHRCCQHNVSHGWPYFSEHLWLATAGNGLGVALYAPSTVTAKVGDGTPVTIRESTHYPFDETVTFQFASRKANRFPLTLRLPSWCARPKLQLNGKPLTMAGKGAYAVIERVWQDRDTLKLSLPMTTEIVRWPGNMNSASVQRGPLTYSLKIGERYVRHGGTDAWPAYEVYATTPWNYGLSADTTLRVVKKPWPKDGQPFGTGQAPIEIMATGRPIPQWQQDRLGLVGLLQPSPARTNLPERSLTLVPMGAARLRIAQFPTVSPTAGQLWEAPQVPRKALPARASWIHPADSLDALSDGIVPKRSGDLVVPRFTWWDHKGTTEWVQYDLASPRTVAACEVMWFDDRSSGGSCRVPASWRLLAFQNGEWTEVAASTPSDTELDRMNRLRFAPVRSDRFRIEAKLQHDVSAGILEWTLDDGETVLHATAPG